MRLATLVALAVLVGGTRAAVAGPPAAGQGGRGVAAGADEIKVQSSVGILDQAAVEGPIGARANADTIQNCYRAGVAKFRFLDGKLGIKVRVQVDGAVQQVDTTMPIGSFEVERCVADVIRGLRFGPPRGNAEAEFDYVWEFRSAAPVQYWEDSDVGKVFAEHRVELKACGLKGPGGGDKGSGGKGGDGKSGGGKEGKAAQGEFPVTFYVMPGGKVGSVSVGGIGLEERRARCLADHVAKWRFPDPLGTVAHAVYVIPDTLGAPSGPPSHRP
ncbi:MAG TPA: AgmX/PglI C-terminal domain-containing protein [Polyangia bacterium]|nr:AgmX/PglI C-terminal domain-containing protein [Polyangia bacterium]